MKYPFTPEVLDALPSNVVRIYRDLEIKLIQEICSRLALAGTANEVVLNDIRILREHGVSQSYIDKMIMEYTHLGQQALDKIYDDAVERNQAYYTDLISKADITNPYTDFSLARAIESVELIRRQTQGEFENITRSIAFQMNVNGKPTLIRPGSVYYRILDDAEAQIKSGAVSYQEAIRGAVKQFADGGVRSVEYASGRHDQIDVVVRRAVMTGISQLCDQYTTVAAEFLETDYFEVSAHVGARDRGVGWQDHKSWQGKVYSIRTGDRYPNIYAVCGLGYVDGLEGANCRHRRFAFVEGVSERTYTDEQLENIDPPPFSFEGKQYSIYEATQKQREIERTIRKLRREQAAYRSAGLTEDAKNVSIRIRRLNQEYRAFSETAGLPKQWERTRMYGGPTSRETALAAEVRARRELEAPIRDSIRSGEYPLAINPEKQARHMVGSAQPGKSVITISIEELQTLVNRYAGSGTIKFTKSRVWDGKEIVDFKKTIGYTVNREHLVIDTAKGKIHYSGTGIHVVPYTGGRTHENQRP